MADIKKFFTPEFRNRLDAIVSFKALDETIIMRVVDKFLMQLEEQLHEKKVDATFSSALRAHLAKHGFDPLMGARPMQRIIQDTVRKALADELLFGKLAQGGHVDVDIDADGIPAQPMVRAPLQKFTISFTHKCGVMHAVITHTILFVTHNPCHDHNPSPIQAPHQLCA
jgi:ATP-dependent Clp protease ATP-binding subunit ClpA